MRAAVKSGWNRVNHEIRGEDSMKKENVAIYFGLVLGVLLVPGERLFGKSSKKSDLFYGESSENFIIRWGFQDLCDHVFDPRTITWPTTKKKGGVTFNPKDVSPGDLVFVRDVKKFMEDLNPHIEHPYILVVGGEHFDTTAEMELDYLDDKKIIAWFSIHPCKGSHPRYYPLPLGIKQENEYFEKRKEVNEYFEELRALPKTKMVYVNFATRMNKERKELKERIINEPYCVIPEKPVPFMEYMKEMAECKFALSPRGFGPDCYRTWEALLVGSIPIVRRNQHGRMKNGLPKEEPMNYDNPEVWYNGESQLDRLYTDLPILIVDDWDEMTDEFLERKYAEITAKKYDIKKLYEEFWVQQIRNVQTEFLRKRTYWRWIKDKVYDFMKNAD